MTGRTDSTKFAAYLSFHPADEAWCVRSIDISHTGVLHKLTYPDQPFLSEIFASPVSEIILDRLSDMDRQGEMLSMSDYVLELPGVTLSKLRMHTNHNVDRGHEASFWFGNFEGQPLMALRQYAEVIESLPQADRVNNLAIHAIDRVIIPALNVVTSVRSGVRSTQNVEVFEDYTARLLQEADDLIMYAELVKRLINTQNASGLAPVIENPALEDNSANVKRLGNAS